VSKAIIREFADLCAHNEIKLVVAGIDADPATAEMLAHCSKSGLATVDISVDLQEDRYNNRPHDGHPSAAAHRAYAQRLRQFLQNAALIGYGVADSSFPASLRAADERPGAGEQER
jgi:hypothetical protein